MGTLGHELCKNGWTDRYAVWAEDSGGRMLYGDAHYTCTIWRISLNRPCAAAIRPVVKLLWPFVIRPHHSTAYADAPYCYWSYYAVSWSVRVVSPAKTAQPIEMPFGLRTRVGPGNHVLDGRPYCTRGKNNFEGEGTAHWKVYGRSAVSCAKWLNRSRCRLGRGLLLYFYLRLIFSAVVNL